MASAATVQKELSFAVLVFAVSPIDTLLYFVGRPVKLQFLRDNPRLEKDDDSGYPYFRKPPNVDFA